MEASDRDVNLSSIFPFNSCSSEFCGKALGLGKCVKYSVGETVLANGSPAKHCGVIIDGQAVAFKYDGNGRRYQLCMDEGCFIGLETIGGNSSYNAKIVAVTDLEVFFWNKDGLSQLEEESPDTYKCLKMMNEGRTYQEQWLVPETEMTDPVLCSQSAHWISIISPAFIILPVLFLFLWACSLMVRRYPVVWLLILGLFAAAGSLIYRQILARTSERLIVTTKNVIHIPKDDADEITVVRLYRIDSVTVQQNFAERLINAGKICLETDKQMYFTPLILFPVRTAALIHSFGKQASLGKPVAFRVGREPQVLSQVQKNEVFDSEKAEDPDVKFRTIEFHAHWALLLKMVFRLLLLLAIILAAAYFCRDLPDWGSIRKIFLLAAAGIFAGILYQISTWKQHRYIIEEDCVKDYRRSPLSKEGQNLAMNHKIQSVRYTKEGFFQNILNYGTVYILAGEQELKFDYISDPKKVQQQIKETCTLYESKRFQNEEAWQREYIDSLFTEIRRENEN